jgi:hypothetical protein
MKALTTRQYLDLTLGFGVMITVRYGLLGTGTTADMSAAAAGVVLVLIGAIGRIRQRRGFPTP